ncbi:NAD-dependent epimerase/dehydratase family protein [Micromonospora chokoriensis]
MSRTVVVTGAGGFLGGHLVGELHRQGVDLRAVDKKPVADWHQIHDVDNLVADLRDSDASSNALRKAWAVYHLAADMGGIGYITRHDWDCASSVTITRNVLDAAIRAGCGQILYTSSACIYPVAFQGSAAKPLKEELALPAAPEGGYGWEKLYSERLCRYAADVSGMDVRIARLFNVFGPHGDWRGGREKAPAALCRKLLEAERRSDKQVRVWGDGTQRRSFLYVTDCIRGLLLLMQSPVTNPINIASEELVSIPRLVELTSQVAGVRVEAVFDERMPIGVHSRVPDIQAAREHLNWSASVPLEEGIQCTYAWIKEQMQ